MDDLVFNMHTYLSCLLIGCNTPFGSCIVVWMIKAICFIGVFVMNSLSPIATCIRFGHKRIEHLIEMLMLS